jgi:hypothetical protein
MGREEPHNLMVRFELIAGRMNCISLSAGDCLRVLAGHFDLVWATGWGRGECEALAELLSLGPIPHLSFGSEARFGSCDWKIEPLEAVARERPLAWVDDSFDERCREWARRREAPVLLVDTEPQRGLETSHAEALIDWARGVRGGPASTG